MARRAPASEPAFGSDSFLDVTANLVGVLIILIVLVGLRVAKAPPQTFLRATRAELDRRLAGAQADVDALKHQRDNLEREVDSVRRGLSAKTAALVEFETRDREITRSADLLAEQIQDQRSELSAENEQSAEAHSRLVSFARELDELKAGAPAPRKLVCQSPLSRPVESDEIHFEIRARHVTFVDLAGLMDGARGKAKQMEAELRDRGRATGEVGPVGAFRLRFSMARENMPYTQSLLYGSGSFRARLVEWQIVPVADARGEPVDTALSRGSQFDVVLAGRSPNKFAVTLWTHPDSFAEFRQLRGQLSDRGYAVAARPLPPGTGIRGSVHGSRSFSQ